MNVVQVIGGLDNAFGGPSYSVPRLCTALAANGVKITLLSVAGPGEQPSEVEVEGYCDRRFKRQYERIPVLRGLRKSRGFATALRSILPQTDVVHNHGLWLLPNLLSGRQALAAGRPYVVSPRGMLSPAALGFSRWKKWGMWRLGQADLLRRAHCIHATSELEYKELRSLGLSSPIAVIPNGVDVADRLPSPSANSMRQLLSFGRLHPKKNL